MSRLNTSLKALGAGTLLLIGAVLGVLFWGGFNTAMEVTNTTAFCTGCHEMQTVYDEYRHSVHYQNNAGVRAGCPDCHVPKPWVHKFVRKIKATNELYHKLVGTIDTPQKFETERLALARNVWMGMKQTDSRECRNCHAFDSMTIADQRPQARFWHTTGIDDGFTCIDCHKGIAHQLPDLSTLSELAESALQEATEAAADTDGGLLYPSAPLTLHAERDGAGFGTVHPAAPLQVRERDGDWLRVSIDASMIAGAPGKLYADRKRAVPVVLLQDTAAGAVVEAAADAAPELDPATGLTWQSVSLDAWVRNDGMVGDPAVLWAYAETLYENECARCHAVFPPSSFSAPNWADNLQDMRRYAEFDKTQMALVRTYLQANARPLGQL